MKYYKLENQVYAFEVDGSQDDYIKPEMVLMTSEEVYKHINPEKYLTEEQKHSIYLNSLKPLTRRQFKLVLLENDLLDEVELAINNIEDKTTKTRMQIEYTEATEFKRNSESLLFMCQLLNLSEEQINIMWA
jgi:hypothetical protein